LNHIQEPITPVFYICMCIHLHHVYQGDKLHCVLLSAPNECGGLELTDCMHAYIIKCGAICIHIYIHTYIYVCYIIICIYRHMHGGHDLGGWVYRFHVYTHALRKRRRAHLQVTNQPGIHGWSHGPCIWPMGCNKFILERL
jgi:hypothetical protein